MEGRRRHASTRGLSKEEIQRYRRNGIVFPISTLTRSEVAAYRSEFEALTPHLGEEAKYISLPHLHFRWAYDLATHPALLAAVASLLGPDLLIHGSMVLTKLPRHPGLVRWHQDGQSGFNAAPNTSAWIALSDSTSENGCMRVVPGSHLRQRLPHVASRHEHSLLANGREIAVEVDEAEAVDVVLQAGEMSLHHCDIVHGSKGNPTSTWRIGFIVRFVTPELPRQPRPGDARPRRRRLQSSRSRPETAGGLKAGIVREVCDLHRECGAAAMTARACSAGIPRPVIIRNCRPASTSSTSRPSIVLQPRAAAAVISGVDPGP